MTQNRLLETIRANAIYTFSRSAGPGGQNVNKVNSRVSVRLPLSSLDALGEGVLDRLRRHLRGRINAEGELVVHVQDERSQARNRQLAEQRLTDLVLAALIEPKKRRPTRPSRAAKRQRLETKRRRGQTKERRQRPGPDAE